MLFKSDLKEIAPVIAIPEHKEIPQLYRADIAFARKHGKSKKFQKLLDQIESMVANDGFKYTSIDTKTLMLMKGMYPCIPGWHCDDFYRPTNDQPDLQNVEREAPQQHYLICLGNISLTEFLSTDIDMPTPAELPKDKPAYLFYDRLVEGLLMDQPKDIKKFIVETVKESTVYSFGPLAFHRGMPAKANGWRTFIRVTRSNHRESKNEIRYQCNAYVKGDVSW